MLDQPRPARSSGLWALLLTREWRHHPWRHGMALLAVALGVALAYSVHLINSSALNEFSQAVRTAGGQPDLSLRGPRFDDAWFDRVAADRDVRLASPVLEVDTFALAPGGRRVAMRVLGLDVLRSATLAPDLVPQISSADSDASDPNPTSPSTPNDALAFLDPDAVFINAPAQKALGWSTQPPTLELQAGTGYQGLRVAGMVAAGGLPLVVMDLAGAQHHFGLHARLSRIDLRLAPGTDVPALLQRLQPPAGVAAVSPEEAEQRVSNLSRAYRVNLTVLALVALCVGAFLVFSVVSLSVAQRTPAFALLGVLGLSARQRRTGVLLECALVGLGGGVPGLLAGAAMAQAALHFLAGDLGGGYFPGVTPRLQWTAAGAATFAALGLAAALAGGWWPARQAAQLAPAQALKGLGRVDNQPPCAGPGLALLALGGAAALLPPVAGLPLAAYASVAALLFGGVALVPAAVHLLLAWAPAPQHALALLALQRARFQRRTATAAMAGVVASLALSVALTVMVSSFRQGVSTWLETVLPADLYARTSNSASAADQAWLPPALLEKAAAVPGVLRVEASRVRSLQLAAGRPAVVLFARPLAQPEAALPMLQAPLPMQTVQAGETAIYVSEAMVSLYGAANGSLIELPLGEVTIQGRVLGVWRDYARQFGSVALADTDYQRLTGDRRVNDLALWLQPGANAASVQANLRGLLPDPGLLDFASAAELRTMSLRIFDRSFAVTTYLQVVAIVIGLVGIATSLSAQVLARRKEFGLLSHLGLTRRQIITIVAGEAAAWVAAGTLVGLLLGLAISMVLVWVVNPQSFHWTMQLVLPGTPLALLCAGVLAAGTATAAFSARHAAARQAVLSVREDW